MTLRTEPVSFDAKLPLGAEGLSSLISSIALTVDDDWAPDTNKAKVGDAFTHGITLCADGVPGMAFPALREVQVDDRVSAAFANCRDGPKRARPSLDTLIRCLVSTSRAILEGLELSTTAENRIGSVSSCFAIRLNLCETRVLWTLQLRQSKGNLNRRPTAHSAKMLASTRT